MEKFGSGMEKFGSGMGKFESGIRDKHPGSATLQIAEQSSAKMRSYG
jgi:hypothetical protein